MCAKLKIKKIGFYLGLYTTKHGTKNKKILANKNKMKKLTILPIFAWNCVATKSRSWFEHRSWREHWTHSDNFFVLTSNFCNSYGTDNFSQMLYGICRNSYTNTFSTEMSRKNCRFSRKKPKKIVEFNNFWPFDYLNNKQQHL
jgi:hypothetical protein